MLTGNYAFFNLLTLCLCLWCFEDATYAPLRGMLQRTFPARRVFGRRLALAANFVLAVLMLAGFLELFAALVPASTGVVRTATSLIEPFEIVNSYGLFARHDHQSSGNHPGRL